MVEQERTAAVEAKAGAVEEDSAGYLGAVHLDRPCDEAVGVSQRTVDSYAARRKGG
ncbi:hypothetical protein [Streptomyces sp. BE308]|uniref:hypothetical protein n=1 Tax=Streptomyces sp. BE308 TaxID=3002529 RepID=UPI002E76FA76|nr:hypothetical protein [Streptomyces sp. BE308]